MSQLDSGADLLIVCGPQDRVSHELNESAKRRGFVTAMLGLEESARLFTITTHAGRAEVTPSVPIFFRPLAAAAAPADFDQGFLTSECFSTLWAAAALTSAHVVNRPSYHGVGGRVSLSSSVTDLRVGRSAQRTEVFSSELPAPPGSSSLQWFTQSAQTYATAAWPSPPSPSGPYRARWLEPQPAYEVVVVLRTRAWRCTLVGLEHLELEAQSIELIERLELSFGTVIWSVAPDLSAAHVARVDPFPSMDQVQFVWPALGPALLEELLS